MLQRQTQTRIGPTLTVGGRKLAMIGDEGKKRRMRRLVRKALYLFHAPIPDDMWWAEQCRAALHPLGLMLQTDPPQVFGKRRGIVIGLIDQDRYERLDCLDVRLECQCCGDRWQLPGIVRLSQIDGEIDSHNARCMRAA